MESFLATQAHCLEDLILSPLGRDILVVLLSYRGRLVDGALFQATSSFPDREGRTGCRRYLRTEDKLGVEAGSIRIHSVLRNVCLSDV